MATVSIANTTANVSGKTVVLAERDHTVTGTWTFNRSPSAPFVVQAGSAVVTNLDADKLDGQHAPTGTIVGTSDAQVLTNKTLTNPTVTTGTFSSPVLTTPTITSPVLSGAVLDFTGGRLTLTTALPVTTADVSAATTLFYTPHVSNVISLYNTTNSVWDHVVFTELSIAVPATTSQMYDVFVFNNAGTPTLELLAWTNDTTRATALVRQDGRLCKTGVLSRRYVGSFRTTTVSGQTEDSVTKRYVWNYYNRIRRTLFRPESTGSWTYTLATIRQANGSTSNQVNVVVGLAEALLDLKLNVTVRNSTGTADIAASFGEDSTTSYSTNAVGGYTTTASIAMGAPLMAILTIYPAIGFHFYSWNESSTAAGTTTWFGQQVTNVRAGISGYIEG